jgi:hypothetical protein
MSHADVPVAAPSGGATREVYYRYRGADGRENITNDPSSIPASQQRSATSIVIETTAPSFWRKIDGMSFLLGAVAASLILVTVGPFLQAHRRIRNVVVFAALAGLGAAAYLGFIRRSTGLGTSALASPQQIVDDARRAVDKANRAVKERDDEIRRIQTEAK